MVFVGHPFCIGEDGADLAARAKDGGFVAAEGLEADDVLGGEFEGGPAREAGGCAGTVDVDESVLFFGAGLLVEVVAAFMWDEAFHAAVFVLGHPHDFDFLVLGERFCKVCCRVVGPTLLVCEDACCVGHEFGVAFEEVFSDSLSVAGTGRCEFFEPVFEDGGLPFRQEGEGTGPALTVFLEFEEEGLDIFFVFVVVL